MKRVILLGGGHAHLQVLQALAAQPLPGAEVMLVSPFADLVYSGMVPGFVAGHYALQDCLVLLAPVVARARALFVEQAATGIDAAGRTLTLADGRRAEYDLLSVDVGAATPRDTIPGAREHGLFVRPLEHFVRLLPGLRLLAATRPLDVVVLGGGPAGVELAMALAHQMTEPAARLVLVTGGEPPLPGYAPKVASAALAALRRMRVTVLQERCVAIEAGQVQLANGARVACDAPVIAIGGAAPRWLADSGLALDAAGCIRVSPTLQSLSHPEVLAAGDVAARDDVVLPRSGVYAVRAGAPLLASLRALVGGVPPPPYRPPARTLNLISCGERRAIVAWGNWSAQGRWAWWWKNRIDRAFVRRFRADDELLRPVTAGDGSSAG